MKPDIPPCNPLLLCSYNEMEADTGEDLETQKPAEQAHMGGAGDLDSKYKEKLNSQGCPMTSICMPRIPTIMNMNTFEHTHVHAHRFF